jgi:hypothetical protein
MKSKIICLIITKKASKKGSKKGSKKMTGGLSTDDSETDNSSPFSKAAVKLTYCTYSTQVDFSNGCMTVTLIQH